MYVLLVVLLFEEETPGVPATLPAHPDLSGTKLGPRRPKTPSARGVNLTKASAQKPRKENQWDRHWLQSPTRNHRAIEALPHQPTRRVWLAGYLLPMVGRYRRVPNIRISNPDYETPGGLGTSRCHDVPSDAPQHKAWFSRAPSSEQTQIGNPKVCPSVPILLKAPLVAGT